jgi:hypothetical protein
MFCLHRAGKEEKSRLTAEDQLMAADYTNMTDREIIAIEEYLYDRQVAGDDTWGNRDQLLWEMNRRGLMIRDAAATPDQPSKNRDG